MTRTMYWSKSRKEYDKTGVVERGNESDDLSERTKFRNRKEFTFISKNGIVYMLKEKSDWHITAASHKCFTFYILPCVIY